MLDGIKILVVEDNQVDQMIASHILKRSGAAVKCVANGEQAIETLIENSYDIVLMDLHMPGIGGYETTQLIRQRLGKNVPVIALTADAFIRPDEWQAAGMNGCICKPFDAAKLGEMVSGILVHSGNNLS